MKIIERLKRWGQRNMVQLGPDGRMHCRHCSADMTGAIRGSGNRYGPVRCPACGTWNVPRPRPLTSP
jgi:hypothetical protein